MEFRLGTGLARIIPFQRLKKPKELIKTEIVIVMAVIAIVKISILIPWS
jgi:hypothetical protein